LWRSSGRVEPELGGSRPLEQPAKLGGEPLAGRIIEISAEACAQDRGEGRPRPGVVHPLDVVERERCRNLDDRASSVATDFRYPPPMLGATLIVCGLLLVGALVRALVPGMRSIALPASVIGGAIGLLLFEALGRSESAGPVIGGLAESRDAMRGWPGFLVAVIFAGLLLERKAHKARAVVRGALRAAAMVWIIILGQIGLGVAAAWLIISPATDVPVAFGQLIEIGFAGGHGTAAALGDVHEAAGGFVDARDLAMFMATAGLVYGIVSGVVLVNIAIRRGWTARPVSLDGAPFAGSSQLASGSAGASGVEGTATIAPRSASLSADAIDPLAFQCALLGLAFAIGWLLREGFVAMTVHIDDADLATSLTKIPLFLFTLIGGLAIRWTLRMFNASHLVDGAAVRRLMGVAMDFLIVAALASLRLDVVIANAWGLSILLVVAAAWTAFCLLVLARKLLPRAYWFELGILNYGMSTGTTAQGMMLLRMVDPEFETEAAEDYALAAPFSAPLIGGGLLTISLPLILDRAGAGAVVVACAVGLALMCLAAWGLRARRNDGPA